jgi:hypothetical protein
MSGVSDPSQSNAILAALGGVEAVAHLKTRLEDLVRLGGREAVEGMLARFSEQLQALPVARGAAKDDGDEVHRLIGLAAILGFSEVERALRRIEFGDAADEDRRAARLAAVAAVDFCRIWRAGPTH